MKLSLRVDHFVEYSRTGFGSPYKGLVIIQICLRKDRECFQTVFKKTGFVTDETHSVSVVSQVSRSRV